MNKLDIIVVGSGGREHAVIKKLRENDHVGKIYALPGNGGIAADTKSDVVCVDIGAKDIDGIVEFALNNNIKFAVVTPDDPLVLGCVDALHDAGIPCFGPNAKAAAIEGSKIFSKNLMKKYNIPTAEYQTFTEIDDALSYISDAKMPTVIKADGLALGKGVIIAETKEEASDAIKAMMQDEIFGKSGSKIVIEEFLEGPEVSVLAFTDGKTIKPMVSSMDHKRAHDGDTGLNTGGMGTVAPNPFYTPKIADECMEKIFIPTVNAMRSEGRPFKGCLYFGLMITDKGPKVIEYNCRFGDPETQVILPLLESDLFDIMVAVEKEELDSADVRFSDRSACCVIAASDGYPSHYEKGFKISIPEDPEGEIFVAGATLEGNDLLTSGGRVLGYTAVAPTLEEAINSAYNGISKVHFDNMYYRHDIGSGALSALKN